MTVTRTACPAGPSVGGWVVGLALNRITQPAVYYHPAISVALRDALTAIAATKRVKLSLHETRGVKPFAPRAQAR